MILNWSSVSGETYQVWSTTNLAVPFTAFSGMVTAGAPALTFTNSSTNAARYFKSKMSKPLFAYVAGRMAPPGRRMGHAGAIISGGKGTAEAKIAAFKAAGIGVAATPSEMADTLLKMM